MPGFKEGVDQHRARLLSALGRMELTGDMSWDLFSALLRAESGSWLEAGTRSLMFRISKMRCFSNTNVQCTDKYSADKIK